MPGAFETAVQESMETFHPVVPFNPGREKIVAIDLSAANKMLTKEIFSDLALFSSFIDSYRHKHGATYAVGGYNELRQVYSFSSVFNAEGADEEPRRLHLGIDIWGEAHTQVMCPLDCIVHSTGFNNRNGDYGGTVILKHHIFGLTFYTLYGHLSKVAVTANKKGQVLKKGSIFAETGLPVENGGWPPHLHFQVIVNIENMEGDYPGVCKYSENEKWLANCPDGDSILRLGSYLSPSG